MPDILVTAITMQELVYSVRRPSAVRSLPARRIAMRSRRAQERRLHG